MRDEKFTLPNPPIVEAVLDIDCDLRPGFQLADIEKAARDSFRAAGYPNFRTNLLQEHTIKARPGEIPEVSGLPPKVQAYQCLNEDSKQIIQLRTHGFSFNRLAPYTGFDHYLPEISGTWNLYISLVEPIQVRLLRLRYINRILIPLTEGKVDLDLYFKDAPQLLEDDGFVLTSFLDQRAAIEAKTGHKINTVLTTEKCDKDSVAVIFDNCVFAECPSAPDNWAFIEEKISKLRDLKNLVFRETVTPQCLDLFQ